MAQPPPQAQPRARLIATLVAVVSGVGMSLQARMNGTLTGFGRPSLSAALWSFGSGLVLLSAALLASRRVRAGVRATGQALRSGRLRWWQTIGGVVGGLYVATQAATVPVLGVAIFSVAVIAGQTLSGLLVDRLGLSPSGTKPVSPARVGAALLTVVGVAVSASGRLSGGEVSIVPLLLALLVGAAMACQQAFNAHVNTVTRRVVATTWQNFAVGVGTLLVVAGIEQLAHPVSWRFPSGAPWWAYFGGVLGAGFIAGAAWAVKEIGVLTFGLLTVAGQLGAALALDLLSAQTRGEVTGGLVAGVAITLAAAVLAGYAAARSK